MGESGIGNGDGDHSNLWNPRADRQRPETKRDQGRLQHGVVPSGLHASHAQSLPGAPQTQDPMTLEEDAAWAELIRKQGMKDAINPDHYKVGGIETIDYMRAKSSREEFRGHLRLTALKYLSRAGYKHPDVVEDFKKARWYLDRLIADLEDLDANRK